MEIQFEQKENKNGNKTAKNGRNNNKSRNKFVGVRQRASGRWVAEIKDTTQKIRMWLGTFETAEEAARAYDEAACILRGSNTRTNFVTSHLRSSPNSPLASRIRNLLNTKKLKSNAKNQSHALLALVLLQLLIVIKTRALPLPRSSVLMMIIVDAIRCPKMCISRISAILICPGWRSYAGAGTIRRCLMITFVYQSSRG
ncbi:hypothetical protein F511_12185 [Dorcoceras hygrometricum]|uniref:AP2/ERF domain-containing protein n=1 Tax=Dorcoceras hygrometricum TaxID=472368 RepID=A0A2Z7BTN2_9LAMI|nr:hypothetical protein F511_12185 [Dorcoceras hygrometricum]